MNCRSNRYEAVIEHRVQGIPCFVAVKTYTSVKGSRCYNAPSSMDYYGYIEVEYELLDRKQYRAQWLERKVTESEDNVINDLIFNHMETCNEY